MDLIQLITRVTPKFHDIKKDVEQLRLANPQLKPHDLSKLFIRKIRNKYTSVGVATALPGIIPGLGTAAQVAVEAGSISADVAFMLRWMAVICYGSAHIYGRDIENDFEAEFATVLGIWCEIVVPEKAALRAGDKLSVKHFDKHLWAKISNRMNQKIGRKLLTKYGTKRGGVSLGRLIPFGIGAAVGGAFNYTTMQKFGNAADDYFKSSGQEYVVIE